MKKINSTLFLIGLLVTSRVSGTEAMGDITCGKWVKDRASSSKNDQLIGDSWLIGYLNGIAQWSEVDIFTAIDGDALFLWMDNYCKANPLEGLAHGGFNLSIELIKKAPNTSN